MTVALNVALKDPRMKAALETPYQSGHRPRAVSIPIDELLGDKGFEHCEGFQLAGDAKTAKVERKAWTRNRQDWLDRNGTLDGFAEQPPRAEQIRSFAGGSVEFAFRATAARDGYEINTYYPTLPPDPRPTETQ